ncbi:MAG: hypothetical protein AB7F35_18485 [Acetobacteraceae bacterium]
MIGAYRLDAGSSACRCRRQPARAAMGAADQDALAPARGIATGIVLGVSFWCLIIALVLA